MNRRTLLQNLALATAALNPALTHSAPKTRDPLGEILPTRPLANTGESITCLGLGGFHIGEPQNEKEAQKIIEAALEGGIRFFDNAHAYHKGLSEKRFGKFLTPRYRDHIFLMTKSGKGNAKAARQELEESLRRMNTDVIDLWQLHSLSNENDTANRLTNGVIDMALKARQEGKIRHIGFTGHASPYALTRMLEDPTAREACVTCMLPINPVDASSTHSHIAHAIPPMLKNNISPLAMKTLADGRFFNKKQRKGRTSWERNEPIVPQHLSLKDCIEFALALPIATLITGANCIEHIQDKIQIAQRFNGLNQTQRIAIINKVSDFALSGNIEYYKNQNLRG